MSEELRKVMSAAGVSTYVEPDLGIRVVEFPPLGGGRKGKVLLCCQGAKELQCVFGKLHVIWLGIRRVKGEYMEARFLSRSYGSARNSHNKRVKKAAPSLHSLATRCSHFFTRRLPERPASGLASRSQVLACLRRCGGGELQCLSGKRVGWPARSNQRSKSAAWPL